MTEEKSKGSGLINLSICESSWNGKKFYSVYLNDYRISGVKPMPENRSLYETLVSLEEIKKALGAGAGMILRQDKERKP